MNTDEGKCITRGEVLRPSQYPCIKPEGRAAEQSFVCRNYLKYFKAEKEI